MRLLLAEDEKALSKALTAILERNNYSVDAVYDGQSALEYLETDNYDGVILDIVMLKVDGQEGNTAISLLGGERGDMKGGDMQGGPGNGQPDANMEKPQRSTPPDAPSGSK